ncbi:MAG: hypothetical protein V1755_12165 [Chloroflexota bacterium]
MQSVWKILGAASVLLASCGPQATPTVDPVLVQATAVAMAETMLAQTQEAIPPTAFPTNTPEPTPSPFPSPTLALIATLPVPSATAQGAANSCLHPLDIGAAGPTHPTLIKNQTGGTINLSLNLYEKNAFGECGAISYANLGKNSSVMAGLPSGYWFAYAWATTPKESFKVQGSFFVQPAQFDKIELCVRQAVITYKPQC